MAAKYYRVLVALLAVLLAGGLVLTACGGGQQPTAAPPATSAPAKPAATSAAPAATTPAPAPATSAAAPAKFTLKFAGWTPANAAMSIGIDWYLKEVEKRSGGRITFQRYWGQALATTKEQLNALGSGMSDVSMISPTYAPGQMSLGLVGTLGYYKTDDSWALARAWTELYRTTAPVKDELAKSGAQFLTPFTGAGYYLFGTGNIKDVADIKGMKVYANEYPAVIMKELGAAPINMGTPELYDALQKGTINAAVSAAVNMITYKTETLLKSAYLLPCGGSLHMVGVNINSWNKLPPDLQKLMTEVADEHPKAYYQALIVEGQDAAYTAMTKLGIAMNKPTPEAMATVDKIVQDKIVNPWVAEQESKGRAGKVVFDNFVNLIKKYQPQSPYKK